MKIAFATSTSSNRSNLSVVRLHACLLVCAGACGSMWKYIFDLFSISKLKTVLLKNDQFTKVLTAVSDAAAATHTHNTQHDIYVFDVYSFKRLVMWNESNLNIIIGFPLRIPLPSICMHDGLTVFSCKIQSICGHSHVYICTHHYVSINLNTTFG